MKAKLFCIYLLFTTITCSQEDNIKQGDMFPFLGDVVVKIESVQYDDYSLFELSEGIIETTLAHFFQTASISSTGNNYNFDWPGIVYIGEVIDLQRSYDFVYQPIGKALLYLDSENYILLEKNDM